MEELMHEHSALLLSNISQDNLTKSFTDEFNEKEYLLTHLGDRHRSRPESLALTAVYLIVLTTGITGNLATCAVIAKNSNMHTATNYYLFSLAVSDALALILGLPPELYSVWEAYPWRFGQPYCLFKSFLTELVSTASILTITAFTVERYVAICHPLKAQTLSRPSRAVRVVLGVWVLAGLAALPFPFRTRTFHYLTDPLTQNPIPDSLVCSIPHEWMSEMKYVFGLSTLVLFVIPMCVMSALYLIIGITLRSSARMRITRVSNTGTGSTGFTRGESSSSSASSVQSQSRKAVLRILVAVLVTFFICWAPLHAQRLMTVLVKEGEWTTRLIEVQSDLFYISGILYFISSTVNPILYNVMSYKYRRAFRETLCGKPRVRRFPSTPRLGGTQFPPELDVLARSKDRNTPKRVLEQDTSGCCDTRVSILTRNGKVSVRWNKRKLSNQNLNKKSESSNSELDSV